MIIRDIKAKRVLNSRGEPTIAVTVKSADGKFEASAPGGKSRGKYEAQPFSKKGLNFSIAFVSSLRAKLAGKAFNEFTDLAYLEQVVREFDTSSDLEFVGANTLYAVEAALLKAIAASYGQELWQFLEPKPRILPKPLGNCIGGGAHIKQAPKTDLQEFLLLPQTKNFFDAYFINLQAYRVTKALLAKTKGWEGRLTDESALASTLDNEAVLSLLHSVADKIKTEFGLTINLGVDIAASTFWTGQHYLWKNKAKKKQAKGAAGAERLDNGRQLRYVAELIKKYRLIYVEDPFMEDDFTSFARLLRLTKGKVLITGDDLVATQPSRLHRALEAKAINAVIIKPNQTGSLLQTKAAIDLAKKNGVTPIISHRSGETMDATIAQLAVGWQLPIIKTGILGKERFAKLHTLLRIERKLLSKKKE